MVKEYIHIHSASKCIQTVVGGKYIIWQENKRKHQLFIKINKTNVFKIKSLAAKIILKSRQIFSLINGQNPRKGEEVGMYKKFLSEAGHSF